MRKNYHRMFILTASFLVAITMIAGVRKNMDGRYFKGKDGDLELAILQNDRAAIAKTVSQGANVNARGAHGLSPLMLAVDRLKSDAVEQLLALGANPNTKAADGNTAVTLAVENYRDAPDIMIAVFRSGGDPNARRPDNDPVIMRFVNDCNCEYIKAMKSLGANLDVKTRANDPIITTAGVRSDWDVVWCLIELGAEYDYESTALIPLSLSIAYDFPAPDSPIYPYKKKVAHFLREHGLNVKELK